MFSPLAEQPFRIPVGDRYAASIIDSITSPQARAETLKLVPRPV
jgi:hypothetical protein